MVGAELRILYDHQIFEAHHYSGVSRYFAELIPRIAEQSAADVSVFMGIHRNRHAVESYRERFRHFAGIRRPDVPKIGWLLRPVNRIGLHRFFGRVSPTIYHPTYYGMLAPADFAGRTVVTVYDMIHERFPQHFPLRDQTAHLKRHAVARADHVICISRSTSEDLTELLGTPADKITVVHLANSIPIAVGTRPIPEPYFLFVGPRQGYKNFETLLRAYAASSILRNDFKLVCFGGGPLHGTESEVIQELGINDRVERHTGSDAALSRHYQHAAALVTPSLWEGFGLPAIEAMTHGCPVITARHPAAHEVCADAAMFFNPSAPEELGAALEAVAGDESLRTRLVDAGTIRARAFNWDKAAQETLQAYHKAAAGAPPAMKVSA